MYLFQLDFVEIKEGFEMRRFGVLIILLMVTPLLIMGVEGVDFSKLPAQENPQETGELLPDPNLTSEPPVEIPLNSPEFSWAYNIPEDTLELIWDHTPGYSFSYDYGYQLIIVSEFVRMWQEFTWDYNQTPVTLRIGASFEVSCTGDFATEENGDDMYSIVFWIGTPDYTSPIPLKMIDDLSDGVSYELEFLIQNYEAENLFMGSVEYEGRQTYSSDTYRLYVGLVPSFLFSDMYGGYSGPWATFDGTVTVTVSSISLKALLQVDRVAPPLKTPKYNTTTLWNETHSCYGIESMDQNSLVYMIRDLSFPGNYFLGRLTSNHSRIGSDTSISQIYSPYYMLKVANNQIYILGINQTSFSSLVKKLDPSGDEIWTSELSLYNQDIPLSLDMSPTGSVFTIVLSAKSVPDSYLYPYEFIFSLVSLDNSGTFRWNKTIAVVSYEEYLIASYGLQLSWGVGYNGEGVFVSAENEIQKYDINGNLLRNITVEHNSFCIDPAGGFYTCTKMLDDRLRLSRWNNELSVVWTKILSLNYGLGWQDHAIVDMMEVGPTGQLTLVLEYLHIRPTYSITRFSRSGQQISQDTFFETDWQGNPYYYEKLLISDMAITEDGLVHLAVLPYFTGSTPYYSIIGPFPANTLLAYELSGPFMITFSPASLVIIGTATLLFGGIAWDYFIRSRTRPEDILPVEEEKIDPWKFLMEESEDK